MGTADAGLRVESNIVADAESAPLLIDLGKKKAKDVRRLRKGKGKLLEQINTAIAELRLAGTISESAQLVIVVVTEKPDAEGVLSLLNL